MALEDTITGQSSAYMLAVSYAIKVSEIMTPQHLAWAPKIPSSFIPVRWRLKLHNFIGGVILARYIRPGIGVPVCGAVVLTISA